MRKKKKAIRPSNGINDFLKPQHGSFLVISEKTGWRYLTDDQRLLCATRWDFEGCEVGIRVKDGGVLGMMEGWRDGFPIGTDRISRTQQVV